MRVERRAACESIEARPLEYMCEGRAESGVVRASEHARYGCMCEKVERRAACESIEALPLRGREVSTDLGGWGGSSRTATGERRVTVTSE